jgi:hypothetical protein
VVKTTAYAKFSLSLEASKKLLPPALKLANMKLSQIQGVNKLPADIKAALLSSKAPSLSGGKAVTSVRTAAKGKVIKKFQKKR